jgi:prefoldin subunit 5
MEATIKRIQTLDDELEMLRSQADSLDNNPYKLHDLLNKINEKAKELDALKNSLESLKDVCN